MNVQELINILEQVEDKSLQVRLECDHGQVPMKLNGQCISYIEGDIYMPDGVHPDDFDEYPDAVKVFCLEAY